ncbi:apolipoprotein N-acyltransferase [Luteipulveratus mongoliensis]|uniref:apolipoprotein N-acyltransferase n=1 Tax=Luteipulveratus mongoliensis TaxID=571913 RepID=UPI000698E311|nr:nitrilase-related carbon-nitrogen hydrolase [Luteipulveratus mongoliensis]
MVSLLDRRAIRLADGSALLSGALLYLGVGLHPVALLTWVALLPVMLAAPRVSARRSALHAALAWLIGQAGLWFYFTDTVELPPVLALSVVLYGAALLVCAVLFARALILRRRALSAIVLAGATWIAGEYTLSLVGSNGAWWSLGYSQAEITPVLQIVSATGVWGISFLLVAVPVALAAAFAPGAGTRERMRIGIAAAATLVVVGGYVTTDFLVISAHDDAKLRVGVGVAAQNKDDVRPESAAGQRLTARYVGLVRSMADEGARAVVLPEKAFLADQSTLGRLADPFVVVAKQRHVDVVLGVLVRQPDGQYKNIALAIPGNGAAFSTYTKHYLIPGVESDTTAGSGLTFVPGSQQRLGVIICKDLDYPNLVRDFRNAGSTVLLAPAWDFFNDGWLHGRMAVTRGVESGLALARSGRDGRLTISDGTGRVVAERESSWDRPTTIVADIPTRTPRTLYARFGDWFAWLCVLGMLYGVGRLVIDHRRARRVNGPAFGGQAGGAYGASRSTLSALSPFDVVTQSAPPGPF